MKTYLSIFWILSGFFFSLIHAQTGNILLQLPEEEQNAIEAIALYPQKERDAVLEAALYPEILVRMDIIRQNNEIKFKEMISGLTEEEQKKIYNLSRYPDLMAAISESEKSKSNKEMDNLLVSYPEEIHDDAYYSNRNYFNLLRDVNNLYRNSEKSFQVELSTYPEHVRKVFEDLADLPGVVSILTDNMNLTVLLGDIYRNHPEQLVKELDSLNVVVAEQQAKELTDWKQELEADPQAMQEYEQSAKEFAADGGYDDKVYDGPIPEKYTDVSYADDVWRPYPYWFGWPGWYGYPCWYPYPWWYHWGYYYGPGSVIVFVGLPSNIFIGWQFYNDYNLYHYPHFTNHIIRHYYGPRHTGSSYQPIITRWEEEHRSELPPGWIRDDKNRVDVIRDYGKFKVDYAEAVKGATEKSPTEKEFLKSNVERYPALKPVLKEKQDAPVTQPNKNTSKQPTQASKPAPYEPRDKVIDKDKPSSPEEIDRATENHENAWDHLRKESPQTAPSPSAAPSRKDQQNQPSHTNPTPPPPQQPKTQPSPGEPKKKGGGK